MNTGFNNNVSGDDGEIEVRLWNYIDQLSSPGERSAIEELLHKNSAWKEKYIELLDIHQLLQTSELEAPSMRFSKNVMEEIGKLHIAPATRTYINKRIIWGIAFFFITLVVGYLVYGFGQIEWTDKTSTNLKVDLVKIDYSRIFNNTYVNVFMMVNVVLGLFLLDRYLANKRKQFREN